LSNGDSQKKTDELEQRCEDEIETCNHVKRHILSVLLTAVLADKKAARVFGSLGRE